MSACLQRRSTQAIFAAGLWALGCFLITYRLGHYALWDDEANTALFGLSMWKHGTPLAQLDDHNIIAFRSGAELSGGVNRFMPPAAYVWAAPFVGLLPRGAWAARLPFALLGVGLLSYAAVMLWRRLGPQVACYGLLALCGNVSLILYFRQARYYGLVLVCSTVVAALYVSRDRTLRHTLLISTLSTLLLLSHYLAWFGLLGCLGIDLLLWGHKSIPTRKNYLALFTLLQVLSLAYVAIVLQPFGKISPRPGDLAGVVAHLQLFVWTLRDINRCEFGLPLLLMIAPLVGLWRRDLWLIRLSCAVCVFLILICAVSPQPVGAGRGGIADLRYVLFVIVMLAVVALRLLLHIANAPLRMACAVLLFCSNVPHRLSAPLLGYTHSDAPRISAYALYDELRTARIDPYKVAVAHMAATYPSPRTVTTLPDYATYPLMWHAPQHTYAWQFNDEARHAYPMLSPIHFALERVPDLLVTFGNNAATLHAINGKLAERHGCAMQRMAHIPTHFPELIRPELFWHAFSEVIPLPEGADGISFYEPGAACKEQTSLADATPHGARNSCE